MIRVAHLLAERALSTAVEDEINIFGRSAFNRYYYAAFLTVRNTLVRIDASWAEPTHKAIPDILERALVKKIKNQLKKGLLDDGEVARLKSLTLTSASHLANTLRTAYMVRIQADYRPEHRATKNGDSIFLAGSKSSDAAGWHQDALRCSASLLQIAKKVGLT